MVLTDTAIRNAKPAGKPCKVADSQGLYLLVNPRGSKIPHERRGRLETANLLRAFASRVFRFAVATAHAERNPAELLIGALTTPRVKHFAAIGPVGAALRWLGADQSGRAP